MIHGKMICNIDDLYFAYDILSKYSHSKNIQPDHQARDMCDNPNIVKIHFESECQSLRVS